VSVPALIIARQAGTRFIYLGRTEGWVDLSVGYTKIFLPTVVSIDSHTWWRPDQEWNPRSRDHISYVLPLHYRTIDLLSYWRIMRPSALLYIYIYIYTYSMHLYLFWTSTGSLLLRCLASYWRCTWCAMSRAMTLIKHLRECVSFN